MDTEKDAYAEQDTEGNWSCCQSAGKLFTGWKSELKIQSKLALPNIIFFVSLSCLSIINLVFCGQLGKEQLAAGALAISFGNVTGVAIAWGVGSASDTLFSQSYGSSNKKMVGVVLQRSLLIMVITCFLVWSIFINAELILVGLQIDRHIARSTAVFIRVYMVGIPGLQLFVVLSKYLQNQNIVISTMVLMTLGAVYSVPIHYLLLFVLKMDLIGAALALSIVYWCISLSLLVYIWIRKLHQETWEGWTVKCLYDWGIFGKLTVAGVFAISLEWWVWEIGTFLMGTKGDIQLAAQGTLYQMAYAVSMLSVGYCSAASIRVGNTLGANQPKKTKLAAIISLITMEFIAFIMGVILLGSKQKIGLIFTTDSEVVSLVTMAVPLVAAAQVFDSIGIMGFGILQGCGLQKKSVMIQFITYYVFALPLMIVLVVFAGMGIMGIWISLIVATVFKAVANLVIVLRINWQKQAQLALKRVGVKKTDDMNNELVTDTTLSYIALGNEGEKDHAQMEPFISVDENNIPHHDNTPSNNDATLKHPKDATITHMKYKELVNNIDEMSNGDKMNKTEDEMNNTDGEMNKTGEMNTDHVTATHALTCDETDTDTKPRMKAAAVKYTSVRNVIYKRLLTIFLALLILIMSIIISTVVELPPIPEPTDDCVLGNMTDFKCSNFTSMLNMTSNFTSMLNMTSNFTSTLYETSILT